MFVIGQGVRCDGKQGLPAWRLVSRYVYDRSGNDARDLLADSCSVFAGKDASKALGKTSTKPEDVSAEWHDLEDKEKDTLNDWITFFSKRYNVVGVVAGATNME